MEIATFRLHTASLHQAIRSTGYSALLRCDWLVFNNCDWCISILAVPMFCCSLGGPLSYSSPVVVFFDRGHPCFRNFNSTIPVDIIRVKSYVNCLFDPAFVPVWVTRSVCFSRESTEEILCAKASDTLSKTNAKSARYDFFKRYKKTLVFWYRPYNVESNSVKSQFIFKTKNINRC